MAVQAPANVSKGTASVSSDQNPPRPSENPAKPSEPPSDRPPSSNDKIQIFPNPLEEFASFTPLWTMACLTPAQFNNPTTYRRTGQLDNIVFSSAGRYDSKRVETFYGTPEYFINNFIMEAVIGATQKTGNTNAVKFTWDVYEPHSMGLFLQSMQLAARQAGYPDYLYNCPFVLKLEFKGFNELAVPISVVDPKYFVFRLTKTTFTVSESGSQYKVEAVPYNHSAFSDDINITYNDLKLVADSSEGNVEELLSIGTRSLQAALNDNELRLVREKLIEIPDEYYIVFPENALDSGSRSPILTLERRATQNPGTSNGSKTVSSGTLASAPGGGPSNEIGKSTFGFSQGQGGTYPFKLYGDQVDEKTGIVKRDNLTIDPKNRSFQFSQGQTIIAMINQVILSSEYAKEATEKVPEDGFVRWWKIDVQIQLLDLDKSTGDYARRFIFRVIPYRAHHTVGANPNSAPIGYDQLIGKIVKKYNYIYTGENIDVLKFDINIDNLFYIGANSSPENKTAQASNQDEGGTAEVKNDGVKAASGPANNANLANTGRKRVKKSPEQLKETVGGPAIKDTQRKVAESFHQAFVSGSSADLIKVELEILGDPYWIIDSGFANYFADADPSSQITSDNTMNYESGDVFVSLVFKSPSDIDELNGLYQFPSLGKESPFSGIYRVVRCESHFNDGIFKQKLSCIRMPGQSADFKDIQAEGKSQPKDPAKSLTREYDAPDPPATSPYNYYA
jgi:hypothetical protein